MSTKLCIVAAALTVAVLSNAQAAGTQAKFKCKDGTTFTMNFSGEENNYAYADISIDGKKERLENMGAASGSSYFGKNYGYHEWHGQISLTKGKKSVDCASVK